MKMEIFWGQHQCQAVYKSGKKRGEHCQNKAYYRDQGQLRCGTHSSKATRELLPKDPQAGQKHEEELQQRLDEVEIAQNQNFQEGLQGEVICQKLRMMKAPQYTHGFLLVFPNFKHQTRKDGFGCMSLSPKALGPIDHGMPGIPVALNLENFHQGAKVFPQELENIPKALELRNQIYQDPVPHRHKFGKRLPNSPAFSLYLDADGGEHRYNYLECRYFYCHWYERLAKETEDYKTLVRWLNQGKNLEIVGYDGYSLDTLYDQLRDSVEVMWYCYNDTSRPFGHEMALVALLILPDPEDYPWNRFYRENEEIYSGVI